MKNITKRKLAAVILGNLILGIGVAILRFSQMGNYPFWDTYKEIVAKYDERGDKCFEEINKWDFYDKTRAKSKVVIMTSETAIYANIILRKGVVIN